MAAVRRIYRFLSSAKLALFLLIAVLVSCLAGVTVFRGPEAWTLIFSRPWFNALLVMLVINVVFCFFGRIWGKRITLISFGMILFHLSFVAMFAGIVYNSLFYFRGTIRLTEGETLPSGSPDSYDSADYGRFFNFAKLKGTTHLRAVHRGYSVDGADKRAAYEIEVGAGRSRGIIYTTKHLAVDGFKYFNNKEGYSILVSLSDGAGKELYAAHIPLQSLKQKDGSYHYITGTKDRPGSFAFPQEPASPLFDFQIAYQPSALTDRKGVVFFDVRPLAHGSGPDAPAVAEGQSPIGGRFQAGVYTLFPEEVRYWVTMNVRYEPGQPVVLASLWVGLTGMILTTVGRIRNGRADAKTQSRAWHERVS